MSTTDTPTPEMYVERVRACLTEAGYPNVGVEYDTALDDYMVDIADGPPQSPPADVVWRAFVVSGLAHLGPLACLACYSHAAFTIGDQDRFADCLALGENALDCGVER